MKRASLRVDVTHRRFDVIVPRRVLQCERGQHVEVSAMIHFGRVTAQGAGGAVQCPQHCTCLSQCPECGEEEVDAKAAAAVSAMVTSLSLFRLATPTAPTGTPFATSGTPPRRVMNPPVTNAIRPLSTLLSVSALGRCNKAEVLAFPIARSGLPARTPSIFRKATSMPLVSTTATAHGALSFRASCSAAIRTC
jgi:hypothetical protein